MLKHLLEKFRKTETIASTAPRQAVEPDSSIPRYPPFPKGLPLHSPQKLLKAQSELVNELLYVIDIDREDSDRIVYPVLERFAGFVHLLPASENHHHRGAGGLLNHSLEVALNCVKEMDDHHIFDLQRSPRERRELASRWRVCYAIAGMMHDSGKPISDVTVTDLNREKVWNPFLETLYEWGSRHGINRYVFHWRPGRCGLHTSWTAFAASKILTPEILAWLNILDGPVIHRLSQFFSDQECTLTQIVRKQDWISVEKDLLRWRIDEFESKPSPEYRVISAIRHLVASGRWHINQPGSRIWFTSEGTFLVWPQGGEDILDELALTPEIPKDLEQFREYLIRHGLIRRINDGDNIHDFALVAPETLEDENRMVFLRAVRLAISAHVLTEERLESVPAVIAFSEKAARRLSTRKQGKEKPADEKTDKKEIEAEQPAEPAVQAEQTEQLEDSDLHGQEATGTPEEAGTSVESKGQSEGPGGRDYENDQTQVRQPKRLKPDPDTVEGQMILALAEAAANNPDKIDRAYGSILLAHPEICEAAGLKPGECVKTLSDCAYIQPDPTNSIRKITILNGHSWILVRRELAWLFENIFGDETKGVEDAGWDKQDRVPEAGLESASDILDGRKIAEIRRQKGVSISDMARAMGISRSLLSMIEAGKRQVSEDVHERFLAALRHLGEQDG